MRKTTRSVAVAITAAVLMSPLALAETEGEQPQAETPSAQSENAQGTMGGMMGGMMQDRQNGDMMPMMAQMHEMMETCTKMMQMQKDNDKKQELQPEIACKPAAARSRLLSSGRAETPDRPPTG